MHLFSQTSEIEKNKILKVDEESHVSLVHTMSSFYIHKLVKYAPNR